MKFQRRIAGRGIRAKVSSFTRGNLNSTMIGSDYGRPQVRLPGSGGANDLASLCWRVLVVTNHDRRRFVEKLDFLTTPGYLTGAGAREATGLPPGTGPYEIVASTPGRSWEYRRNPEWAKTNGRLMPAIPDGSYDAIDVRVIANPETAVNEVQRGRIDWMQEPPPTDRYEELKDRYEGTQFLATPQIDIYYFWMNVKHAPFDDVRVRRAVNYAIAPEALQRIYAGSMRPNQQVLPPAVMATSAQASSWGMSATS